MTLSDAPPVLGSVVMKENSTTHKAEGLGSARGAAPIESEVRGQNDTSSGLRPPSPQRGEGISVPQFENEQQFLDGLKSFIQAGRESRAPGVSRAARFWERKINFSILVAQQRLQRSKAAKAKREALRLNVSVSTSSGLRPPSPQSGEGLKASPSSLRIRVGVSPSPD